MKREESQWYREGFTRSWWRGLSETEREQVFQILTPEEIRAWVDDWRVWANDYQLPPAPDEPGGDWDTWLFLAGRGSGKTRSAVEYTIDAVKAGWAERIAIVGQGEDDVRNVMVEGESGFMRCSPSGFKPEFKPSSGGGKVIWPNGCTAFIYSIADTEALRGPQFHLGWCDEPMAAPRVQRERALDNLEFCLRLGKHPRLILTTTPKKDPWLRQMEKEAKDPEKKLFISRATTHDNAENLAANFLKKIERKYGGTRKGKQEIEGKILGDEEGALWSEDSLDACRKDKDGNDYSLFDPHDTAEECAKIIVAIDPNTKDENAKVKRTSHAAGIIVVGLKGKERFVLADRTIGGGPTKWGKAAIDAAIEFDADEFVAEGNQGGDMVKLVLIQAMVGTDCKIPIHISWAGKKDKAGRAEPVATLYDRGRVHHVGNPKEFENLETQMLYIHEGEDPTGEDFDRLDALVWGMTRLGLKRSAIAPRGRPAGILMMNAFGGQNG